MLLEYEMQQDSFRQYMATVTWSIGRMQSKTYPISPYEKPLFKPEEEDRRSGLEIFNGIVGRLGGT